MAISATLKPPRASFRGNSMLNTIVASLVGLLVLLALPWVKPSLGLPETVSGLIDRQTPVQAVEALRRLPEAQRPRRLYHAEGFGSYLIWAAPEQKVFIDPRIELYPYQQWRDSIMLSNGERVDELLGKYQIDGLLLNSETQAALLAWAKASGSWRVAHQDSVAVLLLRSGP